MVNKMPLTFNGFSLNYCSSSTTGSRSSRKSDRENDEDGEVILRDKVDGNGEVKPVPMEPHRRPARTKEEIELSNLKKKTRKRTRRFEVDGVVITTTTSKVSVLKN